MTAFFFICHSPRNLNPYLVLSARLIECIGGGIPVAYIILYATLADAVSTDARTSVFYFVGAMLLLARAGAMTPCGILLKNLPSAIAPVTVVAYALNIALILCSRPHVRKERERRDTGALIDLSDDESEPFLIPGDNSDGKAVQNRNGKTLLWHCKDTLVTAYKEHLGRAVFRVGFLVCVIKIIGLDIQIIQTQWSVVRYDWSYSATSYVMAYTTLVCICMLAFLPLFSSYLQPKLLDAVKVDVRIIQLSLIFTMAGTLAMGLSPTRACFLVAVGIQALGAGTYDAFKSLLTRFSSSSHVAELYAVIAIVETMARMLSSRMWATLLIISLKQDDFGMGLPFWVSSCFSLCALLLIQYLVFHVNRRQVPPDEREEMPQSDA
ncbi:MAG: hypothetical protein OHK93_003306 [Ramalina farinacea]|uniref:Solute carrier family 46 member 3 n=1 Tax=Ramalina farinacea TaxID=258253 RepID=A0AA43QV09_9LECA|nr:hypothetical protein [Ramalina farinacea]